MQGKNDTPKIGAGHAAAMARLGLRELRDAMYLDSNVAQYPELGTFGTLTPQEILAGKRDAGAKQEQEPEQDSILDERMREAEKREGPEPDSKELERD